MYSKSEPKQTRFVKFDAALAEELTRALKRNNWTIELIRKAYGNPTGKKDSSGRLYDDDWLEQFRKVLIGKSLIISKEEIGIIRGHAIDGGYRDGPRA